MSLSRRWVGIMMVTQLVAGPAFSAGIEWSDEPFSYYANGDRVGQIIEHLMVGEDIPVVFKEDIDEKITANFFDTTRGAIFNQLIDVYDLQWYYDGHVMYVDRASNAKTATIRLRATPVQALKDHLTELGLVDDRFRWQAMPAQGVVVIGGPEEFVHQVQELAMLLDSEYSRYQTFYRWQDESGVTHISSDPKLAPETATMTRLEKAGAAGETADAPPLIERSGRRERDTERTSLSNAVEDVLNQVGGQARTDE